MGLILGEITKAYYFSSWCCRDQIYFPAGIYLLKVNNRNTTRCEVCSKLTIKTPERHHKIFNHAQTIRRLSNTPFKNGIKISGFENVPGHMEGISEMKTT